MKKRENKLYIIKLMNQRNKNQHKTNRIIKITQINSCKFNKSLIKILYSHIMLQKLLEKEEKWILAIGMENSKKLCLILNGLLLKH